MKRRLGVAILFAAAISSFVLAQGRKPDETTDTFPDYNKLEMRPKPRAADASAVSTAAAVVTPPPPPPALNTPVNSLPSDDDVPKPAPKAVPVPDNASEPPMPEDITNTITQSASTQPVVADTTTQK